MMTYFINPLSVIVVRQLQLINLFIVQRPPYIIVQRVTQFHL